ncbi:MAG: hypothetical protein GF350_06985 [Chitinivibrionales bacterium]|nr:hypothetical protein [Chitinivibrionales bacterium]
MASYLGTSGSNPGDVGTNGKLGAGLQAASEQMHVKKTTSNYSYSDILRLEGTAGGSGHGVGILFIGNNSNCKMARIKGIDNNSWDGRVDIDVSKATGSGQDNMITTLSVAGPNGRVGICDTTPSYTLDIGGVCRADAYFEYSPLFRGDAIAAIKKIKPQKRNARGWTDVDHATLPEKVKVIAEEERWHSKATGKQMPGTFQPLAKNRDKYTKKKKKVPCRSVSHSVQLNLRAIQQLVERVEYLEKQVAANK